MQLRDYQEAIVSKALECLENYKRPFVMNCFQASGKSIMIAELVKRYGKPTLVLCMNKELVEQDAAKLRAIGVEASIYSASCGHKDVGDITVATIGSIYKKPEMFDRFGLVIIDECDQLPCNNADSMYMQLLSKIKPKVIGWTGTAFRAVNKTIPCGNYMTTQTIIRTLNRIPMKTEDGGGFFWGNIINGITYKGLLDRGYVAPIKYYSTITDTSMLVENSTGADYTDDSLREYGETNRLAIADCVESSFHKLAPKRVLVAVPNIEDAEWIAAELYHRGIKAAVLHSKMNKKERTKIIDNFRGGKVDCVVQVMILNVGFDLPALDVVVFARPSKSLRIWCQTCARAIRLDPEDNDKQARIVDMVGMIEQFGRIEDVVITREKGGFRSIVQGTGGVVLSDKVLGEAQVSRKPRITPHLY